MLLIQSEESSHALLIGFTGHVWVEVADNLLAFVDGIDSSKEHSKEGCALKVFLTLPFRENLLVEEVLIKSDLVLVHVNHAHAADFKTSRYGRLLKEEGKRVLSLSALGKTMNSPWMMQMLIGCSHLSKSYVFENDADVLWMELIIFRANAISRIYS